MEPCRLSVTLAQDDYVVGMAALVGRMAQADRNRGRTLFARLGVAAIAVLIVIIAFPGSLGGIIAGCVVLWLGELVIQALFKGPGLGQSFTPAIHGESLITFDGTGITEETSMRTRRWSWEAVQQLHQSTTHLVIEFTGWDMIVLPHRLWSSEAERERLVAAIGERSSLAKTDPAAPSAGQAAALVNLTEPVLIARLALAVAVFQLIFEAGLGRADPTKLPSLLAVLAAALAMSATSWLASGPAFRLLVRRSPTIALTVSWALSGLLMLAFALWLMR